MAQWALDVYIDTTAADVCDDPVEELEDQEGATVSVAVQKHRSRAELLLANAKKPWKVPDIVPRGYNIPIALCSKDVEPEKGSFDVWEWISW